MRFKILALFAISLLSVPAFAATTTTNYGFYKPAVNSVTDQDIWGDYLNTNFDTLDTLIDGIEDDVAAIPVTTPVGGVMFYAGTSAPSLWLFSYGQAVSRTTYSALFTALSTTYGVGDGSTTFNLPDCRGRVIAGKDDMGGSSANRLTDAVSQGINGDTLGDTGGEETHTQTEAEMAVHDHDTGIFTNTQSNSAYKDGASATVQSFGSATTTTGAGSTGNAGSGTAFNVIQPTMILNCIIYTGV